MASGHAGKEISRLVHRQSCLQNFSPLRQCRNTFNSFGQSTARRPVLSEAKTEETKEAAKESNEDTQQYLDPLRQRKRRQADSTDWFSSQLTRRFGLAGGLAWLGLLLFGVVSEQVKTRLEDRTAEQDTKDVANSMPVDLGEGLQYVDLRRGGGPVVQAGFLTVLQFRGEANGKVFEDTQKRKKPIVYIYGSRPFTAALCLGVEKGMKGMKAGGIRKITVPPSLGFGERGISLRGTEHVPDKQPTENVPPNATLEYTVELIRVSIAPS